jgi:hypothetical protein
MAKYFSDWETWDEQVPLYDFRGWDPKTIESVGPLVFTRVMPRADLVALRPNELLIIEFDKTMELTKVSKMDRYIDAIKNEYIRKDWKTRKITAAYVTPGYDGRFEAECRRKGYQYIVEPEPY